jgi:hypothetical protein
VAVGVKVACAEKIRRARHAPDDTVSKKRRVGEFVFLAALNGGGRGRVRVEGVHIAAMNDH